MINIESAVVDIIQTLRDARLEDARKKIFELTQAAPYYDARFLIMLVEAHSTNYDRAYELAEELFKITPEDANLRFYFARICIAVGQWKQALELFDSIRGVGPFGGAFLTEKKPLWNHEPLDGKTIFLASEGGLGDAICFARFAKNFSDLGARVILGTYEQLFPLFANIPGVIAVVDVKAIDQVYFDYWVPSLSAPRVLKLEHDQISGKPFIQLPESEKWKSLTYTRKPKVALVWQGNKNFAEDYLRSIPAENLKSILDLPDFQFFSVHLQSDHNVCKHENLKDLSSFIADPVDLAHALKNMDLVISVDSGPAHLAGALGVPTILLNRVMGWFTFSYQPNTEVPQKTPWYDSFQIYQQKVWGQWDETLLRVKDYLQNHFKVNSSERSEVYHPGVPQAVQSFCKMVETRMGPMFTLTTDFFVGKALEYYGEYSQGEVELFEKLIQPGFTVVDVGAHLGAHTVTFSHLVGPKGKVLAFEPQKMLSSLVRANLALHQQKHAEVFELGLSDKLDRVQAASWDYHQVGNFGAVSLKEKSLGTEVTIELITLDSLNLDKVDFIKMDIEGMEYEALCGAEQTILKFKPILYIENDRAENSEKIEGLLKKWGYEFKLHNPPLYNPNNFRKNPFNIYNKASSLNLIARPQN